MKPDSSSPVENEVLHCCAVTGVAVPASQSLRFVLAPDFQVVADIKQTLPVNDAIWLEARREVVAQACSQKLFCTLNEKAHWAADLPLQVAALLRKRLLELLHLARRSGAVVGGYEKVRSLLIHENVAFLLQAADASVDGKKKLAALAKAHNAPICEVLQRHDLAALTGRENQVHVAVKPGGLADETMAVAALINAYEA